MNSKVTPINSELSGQVAVVTGGGRGIGRAIAATLSAAGMTTAVLARSASEIEEAAQAIERAGGRARPFAADVTDAAAIGETFQEIERSLGSIVVLVNNAAIPGPIGPLWETDAEQWWRTLDVNLRGAMLCTRAVLSGMSSRRKGRIINIASSAIPVAYFSSYATSKAALVRFTETIAAEVKPHGISVFAVGLARFAPRWQNIPCVPPMARNGFLGSNGFSTKASMCPWNAHRAWFSNWRQGVRTVCRGDLLPSGTT